MALSTDGVADDDAERTIDGVPVPHLQPTLLDGGVLRDYQVDGFKWLTVSDVTPWAVRDVNRWMNDATCSRRCLTALRCDC